MIQRLLMSRTWPSAAPSASIRRPSSLNASSEAPTGRNGPACRGWTSATAAAKRALEVGRPASTAGAAELSERELTVLRLLSGGLSERDIGHELYVSFNTVHSHVKAIYRKLGVSSRAEALVRANDERLLWSPRWTSVEVMTDHLGDGEAAGSMTADAHGQTYQIVLRGEIGERFSVLFAGMHAIHS
jgi:DNA-binding CsgD family transcriptional regulator